MTPGPRPLRSSWLPQAAVLFLAVVALLVVVGAVSSWPARLGAAAVIAALAGWSLQRAHSAQFRNDIEALLRPSLRTQDFAHGDEKGGRLAPWEQLEAAFSRAAAEVEHSRRVSREFLSAVSHQLSQPLTALRGTLELALTRKNGEVDYRRVLEDALKHTDRVVRLARSLRELAEAEQSGDTSRLAPMSVLLGEVTLDMRPVAEAQSCALQVSGVADVFVAANPQRLQQAMLYLIGHSVQFASHGSTVHVHLIPAPGSVTLEISNQGAGFRPEELDGLFEPFRHIQAISEEVEEDRFRLAVAKRIIEAAGGAVSVESEPSKGSRFRVSLPTALL